MPNKLTILEGQLYGNLKILSEANKRGNIRVFNVECIKCHVRKETMLGSLFQSMTGCRCTRLPVNDKYLKHPGVPKRLLKVFHAMRSRCNNPTDKSYYNYGGRGIRCEWESGTEFYKDMGESYIPGLSIDRINNDGNYSKENCRWTNRSEQQNNRRVCIIVEGNLTLKQWATINGYGSHNKYDTVRRYYHKGLSLDEIVIKMKEIYEKKDRITGLPDIQ